MVPSHHPAPLHAEDGTARGAAWHQDSQRRRGGWAERLLLVTRALEDPEHEDDDEDERLLWSVVPFREDLRSPSPEVWTEVAVTSDKVYTPTSEDVGHVLVVKCTAKTPSADIVASFTSEPTEVVIPSPQTPPPRTLLTAPDANMMVLLQPQFRVVSYNILAESYATMKMYPYCPVWALGWNYCKVLILRELLSYNADVICLQEVQANHYDAYIYPMLREAGYEGLFKCKTREGTTGPGKVDGCATFFRTSRFQDHERVRRRVQRPGDECCELGRVRRSQSRWEGAKKSAVIRSCRGS